MNNDGKAHQLFGEQLPKLLACPAIAGQQRRTELNEVLAACTTRPERRSVSASFSLLCGAFERPFLGITPKSTGQFSKGMSLADWTTDSKKTRR